MQLFFPIDMIVVLWLSDAGTGTGQGGSLAPAQYLTDQLILFQPRAGQIIPTYYYCPPQFFYLPALLWLRADISPTNIGLFLPALSHFYVTNGNFEIKITQPFCLRVSMILGNRINLGAHFLLLTFYKFKFWNILSEIREHSRMTLVVFGVSLTHLPTLQPLLLSSLY